MRIFLDKLQNLMEKVLFEKRFHPFKGHLQQNWWVENMPVVAGSLVVFIVETGFT